MFLNLESKSRVLSSHCLLLITHKWRLFFKRSCLGYINTSNGTTLLKMGCYSAPPPLACTGRGCYNTPRGVIQYYLDAIEYYLGAAGVRTSAILTSYTLQVCSYTPQISPLTFRIFTAIRSVQVSMHHACWDTALLLPVRASNIWTNLVWLTIASGMKMLVMNVWPL